MANPKATSPALTQERFDMFASLAISLHDRMAELEKDIKNQNAHRNEPIVRSLEEAYVHLGRIAALEEVRYEFKELAIEMAMAGVPRHIWFIHILGDPENSEKEGTKVKVKLIEFESNDKAHPYLLKVER